MNDFRVILSRLDFFKGFFGYARVPGPRRAALERFWTVINDFRGILGRWNFPKWFFGYALVLSLQRAALRRC